MPREGDSDPARRPEQILAVVPTLDLASPRLRRLLASLSAHGSTDELRVMIVINRGTALPIGPGPTGPGTLDGAEVVETGLNLGFSGSVNLAASMATFTRLWLLQDDVVVQPGCLTALGAALDAEPRLGAVSPTRVDAGGVVRRGHAGGILDAEGRVAAFLPRRSAPLEHYVPDEHLDFVMSRGMLIRAEAWDAIGGLDGRLYPVGWTDVDLCVRLRGEGWSVATTRDATVLHEKGSSTPRVLGAVTYERNGALVRAKLAGAVGRPQVHPAISREALEIVAQAASALALDLSTRAAPRSALALAARSVRAVTVRALLALGLGSTPRR
jgi:GT2 family glycosyltransferase